MVGQANSDPCLRRGKLFRQYSFLIRNRWFCFSAITFDFAVHSCISMLSGSCNKKPKKLQTGQAEFSPCKTIYSSSLDSCSCKNCTYVVIQKLFCLLD